MKVIIDRFEGDVITIGIDEEETDRRRNRIDEMMGNLLED